MGDVFIQNDLQVHLALRIIAPERRMCLAFMCPEQREANPFTFL